MSDVLLPYTVRVSPVRRARLQERLARLRLLTQEEYAKARASNEQIDLEEEFGSWRDVLEAVAEGELSA